MTGPIEPVVFNPYEHIIWSGDDPDDETLFGHLDQMPGLELLKIDRNYVEGRDFRIFHELAARELRVFDDAKIFEIGPKVMSIVSKHLAHRPFMLNCMVGTQSTGLHFAEDPNLVETLKRFADACHEVGTRPCGVTVLSVKSEEVTRQEFNGRSVIDQVFYYLDRLMEFGFTDAVCAAKEVAAIRSESRFAKLWLNPAGIRPAGSASDDQIRSDTPEAVMAAGGSRTRLVIGRPITKGNPAENLRNIAASITLAA